MKNDNFLGILASFCVMFFISIIYVSMAGANSSGPPDGRTGAPGDAGTCNSSGCHTGVAVNSGSGGVSITSNIPASGYIPGSSYNITVTVTGGSVYGFELAVKNQSNEQIGSLTAGSGSFTSTSNNITYVKHSSKQTNGSWTFTWQAPASGDATATFYAAGNAANNNSANSGDFIYTTNVVHSKDLTTNIDDNISSPNSFELIGNYPNPFNPTTNIKYSIERSSVVELNIYNSLGKLVRTLVNDRQSNGHYDVSWDSKNNNGVTVSTGIYFAKLISSGKVSVKRMLLVK